jgi:hypothetical protein
MPIKVLLVLGLAFAIVVSFAIQEAASKELPDGVTVKQKATDLEVSLVADKRRYKRNERINLEVKLTNTHGVKDIFVYGTLEFGFRGSFMLYHRDAKGKEIPTQFFPEAFESPPEPNDTSALVKLLPDHFLGTYYSPSIRTLNMVRPGKYYMWVEYHCPIAGADVKVSPFWGSENGILKSNVVWIEVL